MTERDLMWGEALLGIAGACKDFLAGKLTINPKNLEDPAYLKAVLQGLVETLEELAAIGPDGNPEQNTPRA
jgi:hypothetical protein